MPKPENKPIIAVDVDEVLFPLVPDLIKYVDRKHKVKLTPEDFSNYNLEGIWPAGSAEGAIVFENYKKQVTPEIATFP
jgi:5'(3')-deoxyribonucleotidase